MYPVREYVHTNEMPEDPADDKLAAQAVAGMQQ